MSWFNFLSRDTSTGSYGVDSIFPLLVGADVFIQADVLATYTKILTDTIERTHSIPDDISPLLWDNCVQSENADGLITLIARAMVDKRDLFIVYKPSVGVLREADQREREQIKADYKAGGKSSVGTFISFRSYRRTDMLKIYSSLEHCILGSLHKSVKLSQAVQIKINEMRSSVSLSDSSKAIEQAQGLAEALRCGQDVLLDVKDQIETAKPDVSPTERAIAFLDAKRAFTLGLPLAYVSGLQTGGLGSTGEADMRAVERGLKQFYLTIIKPALLAIFELDTEFKSLDFRQMTSAIETLQAFDLTSDEYLSKEAKQQILGRMFELDEAEEEAALAAQEPVVPIAAPPRQLPA